MLSAVDTLKASQTSSVNTFFLSSQFLACFTNLEDIITFVKLCNTSDPEGQNHLCLTWGRITFYLSFYLPPPISKDLSRGRSSWNSKGCAPVPYVVTWLNVTWGWTLLGYSEFSPDFTSHAQGECGPQHNRDPSLCPLRGGKEGPWGTVKWSALHKGSST